MYDAHDPILARVKAEVAKIRYHDEGHDPLLTASEELDQLKASTAAATEEILGIAETVLGQVEALRGHMLPETASRLLGAMEGNLGRLFEACGFQDLTGQRSTKVAKLLQNLDGRVGRVLDLLDHVEIPDEIAHQVQEEKAEGDSALLNGPQTEGAGLGQSEIDSLFN
jgi:chemotaxis protein CheZ